MDYQIPSDEHPRYQDWDDRAVSIAWWQPAVLPYGGRDAEVVISNRDAMVVFRGKDLIATTTAAPYAGIGPVSGEFWHLVDQSHPGVTALPDGLSLPEGAHRIRDTGWLVSLVDKEIGLAPGTTDAMSDEGLWQLAHAFVLLDYFPPLGISWEEVKFETGVRVLGDRAARRVKRALVIRLARERQILRQLSSQIDASWR